MNKIECQYINCPYCESQLKVSYVKDEDYEQVCPGCAEIYKVKISYTTLDSQEVDALRAELKHANEQLSIYKTLSEELAKVSIDVESKQTTIDWVRGCPIAPSKNEWHWAMLAGVVTPFIVAFEGDRLCEEFRNIDTDQRYCKSDIYAHAEFDRRNIEEIQENMEG